MERKTTKMLALVAVIGLCAVALIGAAYAAFAGTASTYNEANTATTEYITIDGPAGETEWNAFTVGSAAVPMSTYKYHVTTTDYVAYSLINTASAVNTVGHDVSYLIGTKTYTITNKTSANITAIDITMTAGVDLGSKFVITANVGTGNTAVYADFALQDSQSAYDASSNKYTLSLANVPVTANAGSSGTVTIELYASAGTYDVQIPTSKIGAATAAASAADNDAWQIASSDIANFKVLNNASFAITVVDHITA